MTTSAERAPRVGTPRLDLTVVCESGKVALKGLVFSAVAKEAAERITKEVDGIRSIDNQIRVNREQGFPARSSRRRRERRSPD